MAAGKMTHRYSVGSLGNAPLTITRISTSCMCTEATLVASSAARGPFGMLGHAPIPAISERLAPGEMAEVDVVFDPAAHEPAGIGRIERNVTMHDGAGEKLELGLMAMVRP